MGPDDGRDAAALAACAGTAPELHNWEAIIA